MILSKVRRLFHRLRKPRLTVPSAEPLSPCIIKPYNKEEDGTIEENKGYIPVSLLAKAIDDDRMLNIAVAGNYGVGKSSIINTCEHKLSRRLFQRHRFIRISLASLLTQENKQKIGQEQNPAVRRNQGHLLQEQDKLEKDGIVPEGKDKENQEDEKKRVLKGPAVQSVTDKQIEYSILQQILYHDKPQKTPKSRIRRIHKTNRCKPYWIAFLFLLVFISLVLLLKPSWFVPTDYYNLDNANDFIKSIIKWGPLVSLGVVFILACRYVSRHYTFSLFRVGYKDIEMRVKEDMSIFNAFMDEIVYFFESTKYDVVVFEDLDRFENRDTIFYKLRELNTILNNSRSLKRRINFVYAVLDDLFDSIERVKFFDYIITVIPVINSLNSYDKLKDYIRPQELFEKLGQNELHNLCDYFQDMRLLLNIVNEFNQFIPLLDTTVMTEKILFGLIVYKNYVPSDFALMYNKSGVVASVIEKANDNRNIIIDRLNNELAQQKNNIDAMRADYQKEKVKLRKRYLEKAKALTNYSSQNLTIKIDGVDYLIDSVAEDEKLFKQVRDEQAVFHLSGSTLISIPTFATLERNLGGIGSFDATVDRLNTELDNIVLELEKKVSSLAERIERVPTTLHGIYQTDTKLLDELLIAIEDEEKRELIKFLILNGYLDRHYQYYISYFYPNALKREDRNFVMKAGRHEGAQYDVRLESIDEVLKRFLPSDFENNNALLNADLVREIFRIPKYESYRASICKAIASSKNLEFILIVYEAEPPIQNSFFFQLLRFYDFWDDILDFQEKRQDELREIYVRYCDVRERKLNSSFKVWLANHYAFIEKRWETITSQRVQVIFEAYDPVFSVLKLKNTPDSVLDDLIENERYEFSRQNFSAIIRRLSIYNQYSSAAYTTLRQVNAQALLRVVEKNWAKSLKSVFPDTSTREDSSALIAMLNSPTIPLPEVRSYILKQHSRIKIAELLRDDVLVFAYDNSLVEASWSNIFYYAVEKKKGIPRSLLYNNKIVERVGDSLSDEQELALRRLVVFSNDVKKTYYGYLAKLFSAPFEDIVNHISLERMKILVENDLLEFNENNFKTIKEQYSELSGLFLAKNVSVYLLSPDKYSIGTSDAVASLGAMETKKAMCDFIRAIVKSDISPNVELIKTIYPLVLSGDLKVSELNVHLLAGIIAEAPDEMRITLGRRAITTIPFRKEDVTSILQAMGGEYRRLTSNSASSTISYSRDAMIVVNELVINGYIKDREKRDGKIIVLKNPV